MKHALCIEFRESEARVVLAVRAHEQPDSQLLVELDETVRWAKSDSPAERGKQITAVLAPHKAVKTPLVAAFVREQLTWQTYKLPPAPAGDLADLVHLQAARDSASDDPALLDFLPLEGDAEHAYRVLTVADRRGRLAEVRAICTAAGLQLESVVPLELGWTPFLPAAESTDQSGPAFGVAIAENLAVVWVNRAGQLHRLRTCRLPGGPPETTAQVLSGELRRTALAENLRPDVPARWRLIVDATTEPVATEVAATLVGDVEIRLLAALGGGGDAACPLSTSNAPHAALAVNLAAGVTPAIDLLHPRRPPEPPSRRRTALLSAAAAIVVAAGIAYQGYQNLQAPLLKAETAQQEVEQLTPMVEAMAGDVARRDQVAQWRAGAPNLLEQLADFSQQLRPAPLDSEDFPEEQDAMLTRLSQNNDAFTLTAAIRNAAAAPVVERRLRDARQRVVRQRMEAFDDGPDGYVQRLVVAVEDDPTATDAEKEAP